MSNCQIEPLVSASSHFETNATPVRKLLLNRREIDRSIGVVVRCVTVQIIDPERYHSKFTRVLNQ